VFVLSQESIINEIVKERERQNTLHKKNELNDYLSIFIEEVGEVGKAIQLGDKENLKEELIQCGSVIVRWLEELE
jgi:NTP pyrophosphatase (non-canonical NTP hydrolase)